MSIKYLSTSKRLRRTLSTVNVDEITKFGKIGNQWWNIDSSSGASPLHTMNPVRVKFIRDRISHKLSRQHIFASKQLEGLNILDVGCGGGLLAESLARLGANVTAIDPSSTNIEVATSHSKKDPLTSSISYQNTTIGTHLQILCISATLACLYHRINIDHRQEIRCYYCIREHVDMPLSFLEACSNSLNSGGSLFLSTMNRTMKSYMLTILGAEYITQIVPPGTHEWHKYIKPEELKVMLNSTKINCDIERLEGLIIVPDIYTKSIQWKLSQWDTDVNYVLHAIKK